LLVSILFLVLGEEVVAGAKPPPTGFMEKNGVTGNPFYYSLFIILLLSFFLKKNIYYFIVSGTRGRTMAFGWHWTV
jgi:hypothetical protein